ncbi:MFS transporter [Stenotrophomonas sp.]|uniref:MFS transporter n=1 Tax=Stenotrophomonas sp. TaxID=69392 RepID=UPI00289D9CE9|nr:MFS transporter [Stenotrophomonas sp.]
MPNSSFEPVPGHRKPGAYRSAVAVFSLGLGAFASVTAEFLPVGVLPEIAASFNISAGSAGLMMTLPGMLAAISAPAVMLAAGRHDRRSILLVLSGILVAACTVSATASSFPMMLIGRALVGVSLGAFWAMALAVASRLVSPENSQRAVAAVFAGVTVAMILGVPLGNLVASHYSWRGSFAAAGVIGLLAMMLQAAVLPRVPGTSALKFSDLLQAAGSRDARRSLAMIGLIFAAHFGAYTFLAPLLHQATIQQETITYVLFGYGIAGFLSTFVASHFVAKSVKYSLMTAKGLLLIPLALMPMLVMAPTLEVALVIAWGMSWGALPLCLSAWNQRASDGHVEAKSALFTFTGQVAIAFGSGAGGYIVDSAGVGATFWTAAAAVALSVVVLTKANAPTSTHPS